MDCILLVARSPPASPRLHADSTCESSMHACASRAPSVMVSWRPVTRKGGLQTSASTAAPDLMFLVLVTVAAASIICMVAPMQFGAASHNLHDFQVKFNSRQCQLELGIILLSVRAIRGILHVFTSNKRGLGQAPCHKSTNTITFLARFRAHQKLLRMFSDQRRATPRATLADGEPKIGTQPWERINAIT